MKDVKPFREWLLKDRITFILTRGLLFALCVYVGIYVPTPKTRTVQGNSILRVAEIEERGGVKTMRTMSGDEYEYPLMGFDIKVGSCYEVHYERLALMRTLTKTREIHCGGSL